MNDKDGIIELLIENPHLLEDDKDYDMVCLAIPEILEAFKPIFDILEPILLELKKIFESIFK